MQIFATKWFQKWAKKAEISTDELLEALKSIETSATSVSLGGHLFKVKLALKGKGKSGGARTAQSAQYDRMIRLNMTGFSLHL